MNRAFVFTDTAANAKIWIQEGALEDFYTFITEGDFNVFKPYGFWVM